MLRSWFGRLLPARWRYQRALAAHRAGHIANVTNIVPAGAPARPNPAPLSIHFWTPHAWPSTAIHVDRVLAPLRAEAAAFGLRWRITSGPDLPDRPLDWLLCLKAVPPRRGHAGERTVLLLNDDSHRVWSWLSRFDDVVVVSSPVLASLVACAHPRVWFVEETEPAEVIAAGERALARVAPSQRAPVLLWHGTKESLDGLMPLRPALERFARDSDATLTIVSNLPAGSSQWGALQVRFVPWSPEVLVEEAGRARLGIVPARPTLVDSYLKSAGRLRCLYALGCPAIGDARSPDVVAFSEVCGVPAAASGDEWLAALRMLWSDPARLDAAARRGNELVAERFSAERTARQWLWFLGASDDERQAARREAGF